MDNVEKIKGRLDIVDVVGAYIKLEKAGLNLKACCPFHNEKTPSFFISPTRGTYKCFGCGEGGDIFSFVEKYEGVDFKGALKILAEKAGVTLEREDFKKVNEGKRIYDVLETTTSYFEDGLKKKKEAQEYLKDRGITEKTIEQFRLGFAKEGWQNLYNFLKQEKFSDLDMDKAGLVKKSEKGNRLYDRFRERIIFPLFDNSGRPVAFSGRFFGKDEKDGMVTAKYLNSPETVLFNKSNILYGYNLAKNGIRKKDFSILVEGQMDLLMCHQAGYDNTVASSGTAFSQGHVKLLKRLSNRIVIAFDGDNAGFLSAGKATKIALAEGMEVRLMSIPDGQDPADFILKDKEGWQKALKEAKHIVDFYLNKLINEIDDKRKLGKEVQEKVLPYVTLIESEIEKANFIDDIAEKLGVTAKVIWVELGKVDREDFMRSTIPQVRQGLSEKLSAKGKKNRRQIILRQISGIYWWQKNFDKPVLNLENFEKEIKEIIGDEIFEKIENLNEKLKDEIIFEAEILYGNLENTDKKIEELFKNLKIELIDEKIKDVILEQKKAEKSGDKEEALKDLEIYDKLSKQKSKLLSS
ncbi:MAG: DNA primase [Patescibacteria group bacterium]|nr:DNA primase [Patescibacteria group bacterium]